MARGPVIQQSVWLLTSLPNQPATASKQVAGKSLEVTTVFVHVNKIEVWANTLADTGR